MLLCFIVLVHLHGAAHYPHIIQQLSANWLSDYFLIKHLSIVSQVKSYTDCEIYYMTAICQLFERVSYVFSLWSLLHHIIQL